MIHDDEPLKELTHTIVGSAITVHREPGPGLLESAYERCLEHELREFRHLAVARQHPVPLIYRDCRLSTGFRIDLLVEASVIVEVKAVRAIQPIHEAQMLS